MPNLTSSKFGVKIAGTFAADDVVGGNVQVDNDALRQMVLNQMAGLNFDDVDAKIAAVTTAYEAAVHTKTSPLRTKLQSRMLDKTLTSNANS